MARVRHLAAGARRERDSGEVGTARAATAMRSRAAAWRYFEQVVAVGTVFLVGLRQDLHNGVTSGSAMAVLLLPVSVPVLRQFRGARLVVGVGILTTIWGYILSRYARFSNVVIPSLTNSSVALLLGIVVSVMVILWARTVISVPAIGIAYSIGMALGATVFRLNHVNPWKFSYGLPCAILFLSLSRVRSGKGSTRRAVVEIGILFLLAVVSAAFDSRSYAATFVLAALLLLWQLRSGKGGFRRSPLMTLGLMSCIGVTVYYLGTTLLVDGYLGAQAQARTISQIEMSGSVIVGGRPELQATLALFAHRPMGFGFGVRASPNEILVAKQGLGSIHYAPNNGYVDRYMFGDQIELHSVVGDLWAGAGIMGIVFALVLAGTILFNMASRISERRATGLILLLGLWNLWNLLFSPILSSSSTLILAVGLILYHKASEDRRVDSSGGVPAMRSRRTAKVES